MKRDNPIYIGENTPQLLGQGGLSELYSRRDESLSRKETRSRIWNKVKKPLAVVGTVAVLGLTIPTIHKAHRLNTINDLLTVDVQEQTSEYLFDALSGAGYNSQINDYLKNAEDQMPIGVYIQAYDDLVKQAYTSILTSEQERYLN